MPNPIPYTGYMSDEAAILTNNNNGPETDSSDDNDDGEDPTGRRKAKGDTPETSEMFVPFPPARIRRRVESGWHDPKVGAFQSTPGAHTVDVNDYPQMRQR